MLNFFTGYIIILNLPLYIKKYKPDLQPSARFFFFFCFCVIKGLNTSNAEETG